MITFITRLYYKYILGQHYCEEFTQWRVKETEFQRPTTLEDMLTHDTGTIEYTVKYQERQCTICGKIQQQELKY